MLSLTACQQTNEASKSTEVNLETETAALANQAAEKEDVKTDSETKIRLTEDGQLDLDAMIADTEVKIAMLTQKKNAKKLEIAKSNANWYCNTAVEKFLNGKVIEDDMPEYIAWQIEFQQEHNAEMCKDFNKYVELLEEAKNDEDIENAKLIYAITLEDKHSYSFALTSAHTADKSAQAAASSWIAARAKNVVDHDLTESKDAELERKFGEMIEKEKKAVEHYRLLAKEFR